MKIPEGLDLRRGRNNVREKEGKTREILMTNKKGGRVLKRANGGGDQKRVKAARLEKWGVNP